LQADFDKLLDAESPLKKAILPWRDSAYGQAILQKIAAKYDMDLEKKWKDLPERFQHVVIE
jgi:excinuclease UvrABC ATPase subunit